MMLQRPLAVMAAVAVVLMLPSLIWGTLPTNSSLHNLTWAAQFSDQVRAGILYPRWLPDSFNGLGAPSFYFYPPLAFWADALLRLVTFDALSTSWRLSLTSVVLLWASGGAMFAWLRLLGIERRPALLGAILYMAAPYHLLDHYFRGAFAEFAIYPVVPLVMAAIVLVAHRHRLGVAALAVAYALLILAHMPTALLVSLTAIPAYVLFLARGGDTWFLPRCALGFLLGLGLAAPYLLPALTLQPAVLIDWMWQWGFRVEQSFLLFPGRWVQSPEAFVIIGSIAAGWLLASVSVLSQRLWAGIVIVSVLLMSGLVPWIWQLPMVSKVGFSWRLLAVVEFAAVTALCLAPWPRPRGPRLVLWLAVAAGAPALALMANGIVGRIELQTRGEVPPIQDAREYLPAGYPQHPNASYADLNLELTKDVPLIACVPVPRRCQATPGAFGALSLSIESDQPTKVTVRRFAFPAWRLDPGLPVVASESQRLVSFDAPAGAGTYALDRRTLPVEQWGWSLASGTLVLLILAGLLRPLRP
ncbi:MAG TPA: hypothetical protein VMI56_07555 [Reyranella sp.]|nr:hypothetical protein [Reyranella sp.]